MTQSHTLSDALEPSLASVLLKPQNSPLDPRLELLARHEGGAHRLQAVFGCAGCISKRGQLMGFQKRRLLAINDLENELDNLQKLTHLGSIPTITLHATLKRLVTKIEDLERLL